jgi:hypothetical protein|nr:MAG TPA: hypothetical protein [Caudoviricetes sp.]
MTYETFKYEVKKLGLTVHFFDTLIFIKNGYRTVYCVDTKKRYYINREYEFSNLDEILQGEVFELVTELAKTPLDERGDLCEEEKWYLKHKYLNTLMGKNYLCKNGNSLFLKEKTNSIGLKYRFTRYDIEELKEQINLNDFEMEKVE